MKSVDKCAQSTWTYEGVGTLRDFVRAKVRLPYIATIGKERLLHERVN